MVELIEQLRIATVLVWTPANFIAAAFGGLGFGFAIVGGFAANPLYVSQFATPRQLARLAILLSCIAGVVFYVSQSVAAGANGDAGWPRVVARLAVWLVFCVLTGIGLYARLIQHMRIKASQARAQAQREINDES